MKYHIEINICPIVLNDQLEEYIDTENPVKTYLSQGKGFSLDGAIDIIGYSKRPIEIIQFEKMKEIDYDSLNE